MLSRTQAFRAVNGSRAACIVPQTQCHRSLVARASSDAVRELEAFAQKVQHDMVAATEQPKPSTSRPVVMAAEVVTTEQTHPDLRLLTMADYDSFLAEAGSSLAVVDFYTEWCGPCKMIYPELCAMAAAMPQVKFAKFNCNKENKELGQKLKIKVAPTFHLYKNGEKIAEMTGAKVDKLRELINANL